MLATNDPTHVDVTFGVTIWNLHIAEDGEYIIEIDAEGWTGCIVYRDDHGPAVFHAIDPADAHGLAILNRCAFADGSRVQ